MRNESKNNQFVSNFFFLQRQKENIWEWEMITICEKTKNTIRMKIKIILINIGLITFLIRVFV